MKHEDAFLQALGATLRVSSEPTLGPDRVNSVGAALELSETQVYALCAELQRQGLIDFEPGSRLRITEKGKQRLSPTGSGSVSQAGFFVSNSQDVSFTFGDRPAVVSAAGAGASGQINHAAGPQLGELAAALAELRRLMPSLQPEESEAVRELEADVSEAVREAAQPGSTGTALERHLEQAHTVIDRLKSIGKLANKLVSFTRLIGPAFEWARERLLGG